MQPAPFQASGTSAEQQTEVARRRTELATRLQQVQEAKEKALAEESQLSEELQTLLPEAPSAEVVRAVASDRARSRSPKASTEQSRGSRGARGRKLSKYSGARTSPSEADTPAAP